MTIKYNWQDLQKRIINGREVEKVMYNGVQIRPSSTPPTFDDYLYFQIQPQGTCYLSLMRCGVTTDVSLEISYDKQNWIDYTIDTDIEITHLTNVYFRNKSEVPTWFSEDRGNRYFFEFRLEESSSADLYCGGDVTSLLCKNWTTTLTSNWCFYGLFMDMPIITPPKLPATTLTPSCYIEMFAWCCLLETAPALPATNMEEICYQRMFAWCTSLTTAPNLPSTNLASTCYDYMFTWCTSLTTAPNLPATVVPLGAYSWMFFQCTSLETAPIISAMDVWQNSCMEMFRWCTSLVTPPALHATDLGERCYTGMFRWCTSLSSLPALPAIDLDHYCYDSMFAWCTNIKLSTTQTGEYQTPYRIPISWDSTRPYYWGDDMFENTWWTFTGTPSLNTTYYTSNTVI